ncbi:hypothetical protein GCM10009117_12500 [Gangjinia marincola]|uniref:DUF1905 domain-containing protein n=1 Tax=Gangjinia marincola TaxID=578463 RepID=A0ABP3XUS0_9FLAO
MLKTDSFQLQLFNTYTLIFPQEIIQPFLDQKQQRVKVNASFGEKHIEFYGALQKRKGEYRMMFSKAKQKELGIEIGDTLTLQLFEDTSKYGVEMPEEFEAVLMSDHEAYELFESLTDGFKRSLIYYILRQKGEQKRVDKALIITENLKRGIRDRREITKAF